MKLSASYIEKIITRCGFKVISDFSSSCVASCLSELRCKGRSIRTSNAYLTAIKGFSRWLVRDRRAAEDVLAHLATLNAKVDVRRERRTLVPAEIAKLIDAARKGERFRALSGSDRAVLYHLALTTGLRASELASLMRQSFDLESNPATVTVEAAYSKHRRRDILPLRPDVADILRKYLANRGHDGNQPIWPGSWSRKGSAKMIRKDLKAAGIPYHDESGRVFDFHALRHQFISTLAHSGAHPKEAQALARHSTITLTMDRYTHLGIVDLTSALDRLPAIPANDLQKEPAVQPATGTDGPMGNGAEVPTMVPRGAENGAVRPAPDTFRIAPHCTDADDERNENSDPRIAVTPNETRTFRTKRDQSASRCTGHASGESEVHPTGFEPVTFGSVGHTSGLIGKRRDVP